MDCVTQMLYGMFERQQDVSDATANDMKRAYARLLSGANLTGNDPNVCHPVVWHDGGPGLVVEMPPVHSTCLYAVRVEAHLCSSKWAVVKPGMEKNGTNKTKKCR